MTPTLLSKARDQVRNAQQALDTALAEGADTIATRGRLEAAVARLNELEAAASTTPVDLAAEARLNELTAVMARDAGDRIAAALAGFAPRVPVATAPPVGLARSAILASRADAATWQDIEAHDARALVLRERRAAVQGTRDVLLARRLDGGGGDAADGPALALLGADEAGLARLLADHAAARPAEPHTEAAALANWTAAVEVAELSALHDLGTALQEALITVGLHLAARARGRTHLRVRVDSRLIRAGQAGAVI